MVVNNDPKEFIRLLNIISMINEGDTINVNSFTIVPHNSYLTSSIRWLTSEDRNKTLCKISQVIKDVREYLDVTIINDVDYNNVESAFLNCRCGISNLIVTYKKSFDTTNQIRQILTYIDTYTPIRKRVTPELEVAEPINMNHHNTNYDARTNIVHHDQYHEEDYDFKKVFPSLDKISSYRRSHSFIRRSTTHLMIRSNTCPDNLSSMEDID